MALVLLLLDAFRHDYLSAETTPFLARCAREGEHFAEVEPGAGFCERSEILAGLHAAESGFFAAIGYDPANSPYAGARFLPMLQRFDAAALPVIRRMPPAFGDRVDRKLRELAQRTLGLSGAGMAPYRIPYGWLPQFALTEDRLDHREPGAFPVPSILDLLTAAGRSYCYDTFTALGRRLPYGSDRERLQAVIRDARSSPRDLYLVYVALPDTLGHRHGPDSPLLREALRALDGELEGFVGALEAAAPGNRFIFLGDHGMTAVTRRFDAGGELSGLLRAAGLRGGRDVLHFLDSTMVRVWAMSDRACAILPELLASSKGFRGHGAWLEPGKARALRIPWPDRRYGDHLWLADPGVLVFPDFFHRVLPCEGMHGYDPGLPDSRGTCIRWGCGIRPGGGPRMPLTGVFELIKGDLGL